MRWAMTLYGLSAGKEAGNIAVFGYIRVSTKVQNEDRQLVALHELNIPEKNIYIDKQSARISTAHSTRSSCGA